jgi:hypothetical protein
LSGRSFIKCPRGRLYALLAQGAHFVNYFGRFATDEIARWRGTEPKVPDHLRR